jgi:hypothetical protein
MALTKVQAGGINSEALNEPVFRLLKSAGNQSISNATTTEVTWGTANIDTDSIADLSNNRVVITAATAGTWWIGCGLYYSSRPPRGILYIYKNGSNYAGFEHVGSGTGSTTYPTVFGSAAVMQVTSGDTISINTYHNYGSALNITDGSTGTWFNGFRITT